MKWCYSTNGETFTGQFDTRLAAIEAAMEALDGDQRPFDLGRCRPLDFVGIAQGLARDVSEDEMDCAISDLVGDCAEDAVDSHDRTELERQLTPILEAWMLKHYSGFYEVVETESIVYPTVADAKEENNA